MNVFIENMGLTLLNLGDYVLLGAAPDAFNAFSMILKFMRPLPILICLKPASNAATRPTLTAMMLFAENHGRRLFREFRDPEVIGGLPALFFAGTHNLLGDLTNKRIVNIYSGWLKSKRPHLDLTAALQVAQCTDAYVTPGGGWLNDIFDANHVKMTLNKYQWFIKQKKPTAIFSLGYGPVDDPEMLKLAARTLPEVDLISLREARHGLDALHKFGVDAEKICITGDDAIEPAYTQCPESLGHKLGINLRVAKYSAVGKTVLDDYVRKMNDLAAQLDAPLAPICISRNAEDSDLQLGSTQDVVSDGSPNDLIDQAIASASQCRTAVVGSYHAGVFALAQGIPVVAVANSEYYRIKFDGLFEQFEYDGPILSPADDDFIASLETAVHDAWQAAEELRPGLLARAKAQVDASIAFYDRFKTIVEQGEVVVPKVSIIIPCYNSERYVDQTLDSVEAQTFADYEIIAVNDGSTDNTESILNQRAEANPRIKVISQQNRGLPAARNFGMTAAEGEYIAYLDSDDLWEPAFLQEMIDALDVHPECLGAACRFQAFSGDRVPQGNHVLPGKGDLVYIQDILHYTPWGPLCVLVRRSVYDRTTGYNETLRSVEDWDFWLRLLVHGPFLAVRKPLAWYRLHESQMTQNFARMAFYVHKVMIDFYHAYPEVIRDYGKPRYFKRIAELVHCEAVKAKADGMPGTALRLSLRSIAVCPFAYAVWRDALVLWLPDAIVRKIVAAKKSGD